MRVRLQIGQSAQRRRRNVQAVAGAEPIRAGACRDTGRELGIQRVNVARPRGHAIEALVLQEFGTAGLFKKPLPVLVAVGHHAHMAIERAVGPAPRGEQAGVTGLTNRGAEMRAVEVLDQREIHHRFQHRHFHMAAAPGLVAGHDRGQQGLRRKERAGLVCDHGGHVARLGALLGKGRQAAQALDDVVVRGAAGIGATFTEAGDRNDDQPVIAAHQRGGVQAQQDELLRAHAGNQHVCLLDQRQQGIAPRRILEVEHDTSFAAIGANEGCCHTRFKCRARDACTVTARCFNLDDVGTIVTQHLGRIRTEHDAGHVQYADTSKGTEGGGG